MEGSVSQSVGGFVDNVMVDEAAPRSSHREDIRSEETYAFFAQLNMIADVI